MSFFSSLLTHPLVAIVLLIGILVFVHELGHFLVGKLCGVGVETFSIGFGTPVCKFTHKNTTYQLAFLPLGGYVKFAGALPNEPVQEEHRGKELYLASKRKRTLIILAGPVANFLLAFVLYTFLGALGVEHAPAHIGTVIPDSAASRSGLQSGDKILAVNDKQIHKWEELRSQIAKSAGEPLRLQVARQQQTLAITLVPENKNGTGRAGVGIDYERAIVAVSDGSQAAQQGLRSGDEITSVRIENTQTKIENFSQLARFFPVQQAAEIRLQCERGEQSIVVTLAAVRGKSMSELGITSSMLMLQTVLPPAQGVLMSHDQLLSLAGKSVADVYQLSEIFQDNRQPQMQVQVLRKGEVVDLQVQLEPHEVQRVEGAVTLYLLPVTYVGKMYRPPAFTEKYRGMSTLLYGLQETGHKTWLVLTSLFGLFTGDVPLQALGGPILIAKVAGDSAKAGKKIYLTTMALISINLGVINLFPVPVLDGGQLLLVGMEAVRRRRLQITTIENFQKLGFVMVMCLFVLATYNDLSRFWKTFLQSVTGFFE